MASIEQGGFQFGGSVTIGTVNIAPYTIIGNGVKTVAASGTREPLATSTSVKTITIRALSTNTGLIYVGNSSVSSANGFQLAADETLSIDLDNLSKVYLDSSVNGEGVTFVYLN